MSSQQKVQSIPSPLKLTRLLTLSPLKGKFCLKSNWQKHTGELVRPSRDRWNKYLSCYVKKIGMGMGNSNNSSSINNIIGIRGGHMLPETRGS
jgi:hypothetical protein